MLPEKLSPEIRTKYDLSGVFKTSPADFIDKWYEMQKALDPLNLDSFIQVGIGVNLECELWNQLLIDIFDANYFANIDIDDAIVKKAKATGRPLLVNSERCDIKNIDDIWGDNTIDAIFWSHGPEHIHRHEWKDTFSKLEKVAQRVVILQCPWGNAYNGDVGHLSPSIQEDEFKKYGYTVFVMGTVDTRHANILAYKVL